MASYGGRMGKCVRHHIAIGGEMKSCDYFVGLKYLSLSVVLSAYGSAWAAVGDSIADTNVGKGTYGASTFNRANETYSFVVPTNENVVAGSPVCVKTVALGMNSSSDAAKTPKYLKINGRMSAIVNGTGNQVSNVKFGNNALKQTYTFTGLILEAGEAYAAEFCSDAAGTKMGEMRWYMVNSEEGAPFVQSATSAGWRITQEITGWQVERETVVFDQGVLPTEEECARFSSTNWAGTVWLKNFGADNGSIVTSCLTRLKSFGSENSVVKFSGVKGYMPDETATCPYELVLDNDTYDFAWRNDNGFSNRAQHTFASLSGEGTLLDGNSRNNQALVFTDPHAFAGTIDVRGKKVTLGGTGNLATANGGVTIADGATATIASGKAWTTGEGGLVVNGTLNVDANAAQKGLQNKFVVGTSGVVNVAKTDWVKWDIGSAQTIEIRGTVNLGTSRQTLKANNQITLYPGAQLNGTDANVNGGCHLNFFDAGCVLRMAGDTAGEATVQASIGPQGAKLTVEVAADQTLVFGATAASTGSNARNQGVIKTGDGVLKVTGKYNTLQGFVLDGGTIEVCAGAAMPSAEITTTRDDKVVEAEEVGTSTVYSLVDPTDITTAVEYAVENFKSIGHLALGENGVARFTGTGGVQVRELAVRAGGTLVVDPVRNPLYVTGGQPVFEAGAKIALAAAYAGRTAGVFTLLTWDGDQQIAIPEGLVDLDGAALTQETYTTVGSLDSQALVTKTYTVLKLDLAPSAAKRTVTVMPLGDSITEGTNIVGFGNPNYRSFLLAKLAAMGYDVASTGFRRIKNMNAAGVFLPDAWSWHNGVSGQRLVSAPARVGWRDALEATLDASEIPDVITFKIGTNDQGTDVDQLYAEWVAVMKRLVAARPSTKIVVGSIMNINGSTWQDGWNAKLKEAVEQNLPDFPANQVFFADLNRANPRRDADGAYLGTFYSEGDLHPNWIGHELNAECWAEAIARALAAPACGTYAPNTTVGAVNNVGEAYRAGFTHLATFTPNNTAIAKGTAPSYSYKNAAVADDKPLTKIAYYMELRNTRSGNVRWVWADMDAFGTNRTLAGMGVPTDYTYQGDAQNLHVDTNDGGIEKIAPTESGRTAWLQFTQGGLLNSQTADSAPAGYFTWDWADKVNDSGSYGAMNLYRRNPTAVEGGVADKVLPAQTLLAFSRYSTDDQQIGIGNCAIHGAPLVYGNISTPVNYVETYQFERLDLASYELASIEIWGVPEGPALPPFVDAENAAQVEAYQAWARAKDVTDPTVAQEAAFLLNCDNTDAAVLAAKEAFKLSIAIGTDGQPIVTYPEGYNGTVKLYGATVLGDWHLRAQGDTFFKATLGK